jgi:6-phosphogluconolactonase
MTSQLNRRRFLKGAVAATAGVQLLGAGPAQAKSPGGPPSVAYVGSYTDHISGTGAGISVFSIDAHSRRWRLIQVVKATDDPSATVDSGNPLPVNPSFLTMDHQEHFLYAVHGDSHYVSSFAIDQSTGQLTLLNVVDTGRQNPVSLTVDPSGRFLVVASLDVPGTVITLPIRSDGSLGSIVGDVGFPGTPGPHRTQQLGSQPHQATFDPTGRWLVVANRGLDRVFVLTMDPLTGALALNDPGWVQVREMTGPRHVAFNPMLPYAYSIDELRATVTTYRWDAGHGGLQPLQVLPSQPSTMTGDLRPAEIAVAPSGRYVYASNRSGSGVIDPQQPQDTIGVWSVDTDSGLLSPVEWVSTEGYVPRFFTLDSSGRRLYAANQATNTIVPFNVNQHSGRLSRSGNVVAVQSPVCIVLRNGTHL